MKRFLNSFSFTILLMVIIALGAVIMRMVARGMFQPAPKVEILPNGGTGGTLKVVTDIDYWPYSFIDKEGKLSGREIEIAHAIANHLGMNIEITALDWNECIHLAEQHQADLVLTCEESGRECDNLINSLSLSSDDYVVFGKKKIEKISQLCGTRLAQLTYGNVNPTLAAAGLEPYMTLYPSHRDVFKAIEKGDADYTVIRYTPALGILKDLGFTDIKPQCFAGRSFFCIGVDKDKPELARKINDAIMDMRFNGEMSYFSDKWLTTYVKPVTFAETMSEYPMFFIFLLLLLGVHATILYRREKREHMEVQAANQRSQEALAFTNFVMDRFVSTYSVNLKTREFKVYKRNDKLEKDYPVVPDYVDSIKGYIDKEVHPDDRAELLAFVQPENLSTLLKDKGMVAHNYRIVTKGDEKYFSFRAYRGADENNVCFAFADITDEVQKERELQQAAARVKAFDQMAGEDGVFIINCLKDTRKTIHDNCHGATRYSDLEKYSVAFGRYVENCVAEVDREMMRKIASPAHLLQQVKNGDEYRVVYRDITTGIQHFYEMRVIRYSDTEVLQSFKENDRDITSRLMLAKLEDDYFALFGVDLDSGQLQVLKDESRKTLGDVGTVRPFTEAMQFFATHFEKDPKEFFEKISNISYLKRRFAKEDKATFQYKSTLLDEGEWGNITELVLSRHEDGTPSILVIGFSKLDAERNEVIRLEQTLMESLSILGKDQSPSDSINELLALAGNFYGADRSYIFEYGNTRDTVVNTYEWCANGIEPMIDKLQEVPAEQVDGWFREFEQHGAFFMDTLDSDGNTDDTRKTLEMQGIKWLVTAPITKGGEFVGFIGVDNPTKAKRNVQILRTVASVTYSEILKRKEDDEQHVTLSKLTDSFISVYYADLSRDYLHNWKIDEKYANAFANVSTYSGDMGGYVQNCIAESERERCIEATKPETILKEFKTKDRFSVEMTDIMLGSERNCVFDFIKVSSDGSKFVMCCRDVTEVIKTQKEQAANLDLANQQRHIKAFGDMVNAALWSLDINQENEVVNVYWSDEARRMLGYKSEEDFPNKMDAWSNILHPEDKEPTIAKFTEGLKSRNTEDFVYDNEYRLLRKTGEYCWYHAAGRMETHDDGTRRMYGIIYDISAEKKLEEQQKQLEEALSMAQSANRAKTTFLNSMSHDIRTPMNAIIGFTGLAASHIDNKEQTQDYLAKISQASNHLLSLINDVLDMSRIESGKMNLDEKPENLPAIIHTLHDIVQADIHNKRHDFFIDTVNVNDENIICDKLRLNQVLLNILSNAIKYTAQGGTISMRITEKTVKPTGYATYEFCVKDNGMGMDAEYLKTIFDPFTRVKSSTVSGIQGTGLGMAITKNIVDMMGGKIEVQSKPGKGTQMVVTFDFKLQEIHRETITIRELQGLKALVADDDANTCVSISKMLAEVGMRAEWCTTGKEAIFRAETAYHDGTVFKVYIIDWLMPDMNGIETTRRIRKVIGDDTPIIILTAYDWSDIEDEAREAGVTAFVSKPMFPSDLQRVLNSCLGKKETILSEQSKKCDFSGRKILLVEDNELNREIAIELLEEYGVSVDTAEDGTFAVEKIKQAKDGDYDIILMDIQMPIMNGYEATKQIRALGTPISKIPIIAMTADAFEEDRKLAFEAGMNEHIIKPIKVDKLKETLSKFL